MALAVILQISGGHLEAIWRPSGGRLEAIWRPSGGRYFFLPLHPTGSSISILLIVPYVLSWYVLSQRIRGYVGGWPRVASSAALPRHSLHRPSRVKKFKYSIYVCVTLLM
jgi:hypothetical protein